MSVCEISLEEKLQLADFMDMNEKTISDHSVFIFHEYFLHAGAVRSRKL